MKLSELGEFGLIERIARTALRSSRRTIVGIGDDAAVLKPGKAGELLLATTDTMVEGVHFDLSYASYYSVGYKALSSNISDCAAMGGNPREMLVTVGLSRSAKVSDVDDLYRGIRALAKTCGISLIGGDTISSPFGLIVSITLLGEVKKKDLLLRSGARVGDVILVAGDLGGSACGLKILQCRDRARGCSRTGRDNPCGCPWTGTSPVPTFLKRHLMPEPMVKEGMAISRSRLATAMIDNSDGLARCVIEICRMSGVGAKIFTRDIPIAKETAMFCKKLKIDPLALALNGGEDYGLVFTAPKLKAAMLIGEIKKRTGTRVTVVGEIVQKKAGIKLIKNDDSGSPLTTSGYDHFRS